MSKSPISLVRPLVRRLHEYVPGEQPKIRGLIKLNTNENPYQPAPAVLEAVREAVDDRLRLYPNPTAQRLREKLAAFHGCAPENIIVGNGSDELLALATRAFGEPGRSRMQYFAPSYSLYPVLGEIQGLKLHPVPLEKDFQIPANLKKAGWDSNAALSLITTPNAPSGRGYPIAKLAGICTAQKRVVVLDEAYVDFARENASQLALTEPNVLVARTFSKAYSLCFQRIGYFLGHPVLISALQKLRDSYNVNGLGQIAAEATLDNLSYYRSNFEKIIRSRERLARALTERGFKVCPSETNFLFVEPPGPPAKQWLSELRENKILVRWFDAPNIRKYLRITIGSETEIDKLIKVIGAIRDKG